MHATHSYHSSDDLLCLMSRTKTGSFTSLPVRSVVSFSTERMTSLFEQDVGGGGGDAAVVVPLAHEHIAVVAPVCRPRVFHQPIFLAVELAVTHGKDWQEDLLRKKVESKE